MPSTTPRLPKGLHVTLSDIEHGYSITATAYVSWDAAKGSTGGPLTCAFHGDTLVMYTPSGSGSQPLLRFFLRDVPYNIRAQYERTAEGWRLNPAHSHIDRSEWMRVADMRASDAARRDINAILAEVGRQITEARPDLFMDAEVARLRNEAQAAAATVQRLERELAEARAAAHEADVALTLGEAARQVAQGL